MVESRSPRSNRISAVKHFSSRRSPSSRCPCRCACDEDALLLLRHKPARACIHCSAVDRRKSESFRESWYVLRSVCESIRPNPESPRSGWLVLCPRGEVPKAGARFRCKENQVRLLHNLPKKTTRLAFSV